MAPLDKCCNCREQSLAELETKTEIKGVMCVCGLGCDSSVTEATERVLLKDTESIE